MKYTYLIIYKWGKDNHSSWGRCVDTVDKEIDSIEDIVSIENGIKEEWNYDDVILLDYKLLRKEVE